MINMLLRYHFPSFLVLLLPLLMTNVDVVDWILFVFAHVHACGWKLNLF